MKKVFQRALNILTLLTVVFALLLPQGYGRSMSDGIIVLLGGLIAVLIANYIFFGKLTLWHKD